MPSIVIPRRQLVQPQGLSGVNPDIPPPSLVFNGGQIYRGEQPVSDAAEMAAGRGGRGVRNGAVVYTANADRYLSTTGGTALVVLSRVGAAQASTAFAFGTYNNATYRFSAHLTWSDGNIYFDFGGTSAPNRVVATAQTVDSTPTAIVLTAGPGGMRIFRDGRLIASSSTAPTRGNPTGCFFGLGLDPTSGATPTPQVDTGATYYAQAFWPEQINDRIAEQLSADPWGLFKAPPRRLYFDVPAGSGVAGTLSASETGSDAASIAGTVLVRGALSAAEVGADTASASGVVRVSGAASAAETGTDTAAAAGKVIVSGALASAEAGSDSAAASGTVRVAGTLAATESAADTFAAAGSVAISGALASTEVGADAAVVSGKVLVSGTASAAEAEHDQAAAAGAVLVSGALSGTETGADYAVIVGGAVMPPATGVLAATEAGLDTAALAGALLVSGAAAASEAAADVAAVAGTVLVRGEVAAVEAGADAVAATGHVPVSGALLATESGTDFALINGSSVVITVGVLLASETGTDTAAIGGAVRIGGTFAAFEDAADIAVLDGAVLVSGALDAAETGQDTAVIGSPPRDMTPRKGFIAGAALNRRYLTGASTSRRFSA